MVCEPDTVEARAFGRGELRRAARLGRGIDARRTARPDRLPLGLDSEPLALSDALIGELSAYSAIRRGEVRRVVSEEGSVLQFAA